MTQSKTVVGYVRVSTDEQGAKGASLAAQRSSIRAACKGRGLQLLRIEEDVQSGSTMKRPGLQRALDDCRSGAADGIVVAKLDRLSRSLVDFATLLEEARAKHFNVIAHDLGLDLDTPAGEFVASVLAAAAQWERRAISDRTKSALAQRRAEGVRLGRPASIPAEVAAWIQDAWHAGATLPMIAERLNDYSIPTARGGRAWRPSSLQKLVAGVKPDRRRRARGLSIPPGGTYRGAGEVAAGGGRLSSREPHTNDQEAHSEQR